VRRFVYITLAMLLILVSLSIAGIKKGDINDNENNNNQVVNISADFGKKFGPYYQLWASGGYRYNIRAKDSNGNYLTDDQIADLVEEFIHQNPNATGAGQIRQFLESRGYTVERIDYSSEDVRALANNFINQNLAPYMEILNALGINPRIGETGIAVTNQWAGRRTGIYDVYANRVNQSLTFSEGDFSVTYNVNISYKVQAEVIQSPIVLDLDGNGVIDTFLKTHIPRNVNPAYYPKMKFVEFDIMGNGFSSMVEWIGPKDGFLIKPSEETMRSGLVTGNELFGTAGGYLDGFQKLSLLDKNGDNKLTGEELEGLYVWQDLNSNGKAEKGELKTLKELGITELGLTHRNYESYYVANGRKYKMWDFWPTTIKVMKTIK